MILNMAFYRGKDESLSEDEKRIIENISEKKNYSEIIEKEPTINNYIHLSYAKENLLNWYDFKKNCSILEIGTGFGELTNLLVRKSEKVVSIEESLTKAKILEKKFESIDNLEIIVGDFYEINLDNKFDYIIITDYIENNNFYEILDKSRNLLEKDGTILIALNNKYGIKNWKGKDDYKALLNKDLKFTKSSIESDLGKLGFINYKFYYIYPEYSAPNLIYTDNYKMTIEDISRNFELVENSEATCFKENEILENLLKDESKIINFFVNSFLIEISNSSLSDVKYVTFTNYRKIDKQIQTIIKSDKVIKRAITKQAEKHIKEMIENQKYFPKENCVLIDKKKDDTTVESDFITGKRLDEMIELNPEEEFYKYREFLFKVNKIISFEEIDKTELLESLRNIDKEKLKKLNFVQYGFIDMVPKNCFVVCGVNFFFDQEWMLKYIPLEYILYRAIKNTYSINKEELYTEFGLDKYIEIFEEIENEFRNMIIDKTVLEKILAKAIPSKLDKMEELKTQISSKESIIKNLEDQKNNLENQRNSLEEQKNNLENQRNNLELENNDLKLQVQERDNRLTIIANSLSWKITKPIRWISEKARILIKKLKREDNN